MTALRRCLLACALAATVAAGCSSNSKSSTASTASTATSVSTPSTAPSTSAAAPASPGAASRFAAIGAAAPSSYTVSLAKSSQGIFLIDAAGEALYVFANDTATTNACTGDCAKTWPAAPAPGAITTGPVVAAAQVTNVGGQLAYYGHLLHTYSGDTAPGQTNGVGIPNWNLIGPFGNVMLPRG